MPDIRLHDGAVKHFDAPVSVNEVAKSIGPGLAKAALAAKVDGKPIGTCLLVESEIEPNHDVSPWLAGLFVVPEHRRKGAGAVLVQAIEDQARQRGFSRLYLYTTHAVGFYARLGWSVLDHTNWKGLDTALMVRDL